MKAWLVSWIAASGRAEAEVADEVILVLNSQWAIERVAAIVELFYTASTSDVGELARNARRPAATPYRATIENYRITCGHNPYLYARLVSDVEVTRDSPEAYELISWTEPDHLALAGSRVVKTANGNRRSFQRRRDGPAWSGLTR